MDRQIGLEQTPEEYVANLVTVFREVKRVLREDGTLWLNLGSSYASGGSGPNRSPLLWRAPACGTDGKALPDSQVAGRVCPGSDDGRQGAILSRRDGTVRTGQSVPQGEPQTSQTGRDIEPKDCDHEATASACQSETPTSSPASRLSADTSVCTSGTSPKSPPLAVRTLGKESFYSACQSPDCRGIGRCGLCWCKLAIPSLNVKAKDQISIPHLVAFALQADGWYLRQDCIWAKGVSGEAAKAGWSGNPMPESVTDRCCKAHEYVFLLAKSQRYYFDSEAIKEESSLNPVSVARRDRADFCTVGTKALQGTNFGQSGKGMNAEHKDATRTKRSVWTIATKPYSGSHFATFPPDLVAPMIDAGCPQQVCPTCKNPYIRQVEKEHLPVRPNFDGVRGSLPKSDVPGQPPQMSRAGNNASRTIAFHPSCSCQTSNWIGGTVLDPFAGSGTVGLVAEERGRNSILIELNPAYVKLIKERTAQMGLFTQSREGEPK